MRKPARLVLAGAAGVALVGLAAVGWLAWTAREARAELLAARAELGPLRTEVLAGDATVTQRITRLQHHAAAAHEATDDPVWTVVAAVPWLGGPIATVRGMTEAVDAVAAQSVPALAAAATGVHPARLLDKGSLDVAGLAEAAGPLRAADESLRAERDRVAQLSPGWLSAVSEAHTELLEQLRTLSRITTSARTASELAPSMLGKDGARRYFVAFQNPAEARGTGGLLDAFAIVRAEQGRVVVERTGANTQLPQLPESITGIDETFLERYGPEGATSLWLNANLSPHFPEVGAAWLAMWQSATGQELDGAVALDPAALADVLRATGPVTAPVVGTVGADRIEKLVLLEQYQRADLAAERKQLMLGVGVAAMDAILTGKAPARELVPGLDAAARGRHLLLFSATAGEQSVLERSGLAGAVPDTGKPFAQAVVINAAGNKLDTWLSQTLAYQVQHCAPAGRQVSVSVSLTNSVPRKGLPEYVTVRSDKPLYDTKVGQNRVGLEVLVTRGSHLEGAMLDGVPVMAAPPEGDLPSRLPDGGVVGNGRDSGFITETTTAGRPSFGMNLEIEPGARRTLVLQLREPAGVGGSPLLPVQAMVNPPTATADVSACGVS
ncbi:MAG: DUF4012 domain-containing protein [Kineosporiaceae bacterium]|nr:DUF4012 domain-containing protein [Kineosporiaceae bacterium]